MNNKGALRVSLVPLFIIIAIIAGAGFFLMKGDIELPSFTKKITEVRRIDGYPTVVYTNQILDKQRRVIKSQEELNDFLNYVDPQSTELSFTENIDFTKEYLIGVSTETLATNGYELKVKRIVADKDRKLLTVVMRESRPDDNCEVDTQSNVAVDIVAISQTDWTIGFERQAETALCESETSETTEATETTENTENTEATE